MGTQVKDNAPTPAYLPLKTWENFIDLMNETVIPQIIDNSVMSKYPGSIKPLLRGALRFAGHIDDAGVVQPKFKALVKARGTEEWREEFTIQFSEWYAPIIGNLDITSATLQQLKDRFRAAGVDGSVLIKAVRFYLAGLKATGAKYSPHFNVRELSTGVAPKGVRKPKATKPSAKTQTGTPTQREDAGTETPDGFNRLALPLKGDDPAVLILPEGLTEAEWEMLSSYVRMFYGFKKN